MLEEDIGWAIVELMGRRRQLVGKVGEKTIAGVQFVRIDLLGKVDLNVLGVDVLSTQYYAPQAVYAITPCSEEMAVRVGKRLGYEPVPQWALLAPEEDDDAQETTTEWTEPNEEDEQDACGNCMESEL